MIPLVYISFLFNKLDSKNLVSFLASFYAMNLSGRALEALKRQKNFIPPYCPNPGCVHHRGGTSFFIKWGMKKILKFPYFNQRYQCKSCFQTFCYTFFKLSYREKNVGLNKKIFKLNLCSASKGHIARELNVSERLVRDRQSKMARWALLTHAKLTENLKIEEGIVYDGLENFAYSQYDPNNINHAIGKDSLFTYDFNFAPMNRKGRMSERQKAVKAELEESFGSYPKGIIRLKTAQILRRLYNKTNKNLLLYSDNHYLYRYALKYDLADCEIYHDITPSTHTRNYKNKLFVVNNFDMQIRQTCSAFRRETIAFSKNSVAMIEKFVLQMCFKNYMRSVFYKKHKRDPETLTTSPAMRVGLTTKILSFEEYFKEKVTITQVNLNEDWLNLVKKVDPYSRRVIKPYNGI